MKPRVRIVVVAVAKVIILQNTHYYYFYYYHPYPALHNPNPYPKVCLCDEPVAHSCEILPYVLLMQMKFFVNCKRTSINSIVLFGFQGFTNVPLYKLMQHRPKVASPDLQEMSDQ